MSTMEKLQEQEKLIQADTCLDWRFDRKVACGNEGEEKRKFWRSGRNDSRMEAR